VCSPVIIITLTNNMHSRIFINLILCTTPACFSTFLIYYGPYSNLKVHFLFALVIFYDKCID